MKFQSATNLLTAILSAVCIINSIPSRDSCARTFVGACPLQLAQVCTAVKMDLKEAKPMLRMLGPDIDGKEIDEKCSCTKAKSVCNTLAKEPPYNSENLCNQIKNVFLDDTVSGIIDCKTCAMIKNTCNLLKSCKAPDNPNNYTITSQTSTLIQSSITASFSNEFMPSTSIIVMASSSATDIRLKMVNYTTHAITNATVGLHNIHPSSALSEAITTTSSIKSGGIGSKDLLHSLVFILCLIMVIVY